ncbi:NAD(+) diphosphatase [Alteromonas sp. 1_MG-2023]|uniref:NAD(+) diphosphatase n=1 Tax=Alteromonas sp. 1_MG-2023 TaxID=3062669 RepID=UPI0026E438D0|nr:NAD(+) diphosphatase [Alteromonas sp. 1_MG-2023]MDO6568540.1 NAD(+) diphosphatase [Alteromonas sp. 1_MG-2023]
MMIKRSDSDIETEIGQWIIFSKGRIVIRKGEIKVPLAHINEFSFLENYRDEVHQLPPLHESAEQNEPVFVVDLGAETIEDDQWESVSLRQVLFEQQDMGFSIIGRAWQYVHFLRTHQFCGQCGSHTERVNWEMAVHCHRCHHRSYPRVSPCIIVSIHNNEKLLLAKGVRHKEANMYSTLAGFVESGESLEEAVHREVFEEVGVKVKNLRYIDSQPWPFPHSIMVGFIAEYESGEIRCQENEIDDAQWFSVDALPTIPPPFSIAGKLIAQTLSQLKDK